MKMKMKKFITFFAVVLTAFNFVSCDNEPIDPAIVIGGENPGENPGNPTAPAVFKADFDGQTFTTSTAQAYISGGSITLSAIKPNGESFAMILDGTATGTYPANANLIGYSPSFDDYSYAGNHPTDENANTGSIIVTSINTENQTISGTFSFTGYWTDYTDDTIAPKEFSNGVFTNIPYTSVSPTGDTFDATLNGNVFNDVDILTVESSIAGQDFISIGARNLNDDSITVSVRSTITAGTYAITGDVGTDQVQINFAPETEEFGTTALSGSVTITEKTATRIKGTFNGTVVIGEDTFTITGGSFDVEY